MQSQCTVALQRNGLRVCASSYARLYSPEVAGAGADGEVDAAKPVGDDGDRTCGVLHLTADQQRRRGLGQPAVPRPHPGRAQDVDHPGVVLEVDEGDALRGCGPLPMRHRPATSARVHVVMHNLVRELNRAAAADTARRAVTPPRGNRLMIRPERQVSDRLAHMAFEAGYP
jgi:hypothetical protein